MHAKPLATIVSSLCLALASVAHAQRSGPPAIDSPVVNPDRTVTFKLRAPTAKQVQLSGQFQRANQPMTADPSGVWSVTVGPLEPNLYPYSFIVDGTSVADPSNMLIFPNERFKNSLVDVPGDKPALYNAQDVPHGEVTYCYYQSKSLNTLRPLLVYTPPGYRASTDKFPVLYLVSGTTDTEETWYKVGRANFIADNLIAQKHAVPMIIVMPYGNMLMGTPDPTTLQAAEMYKAFATDLTGSIMPYVEANYRTLNDREHRAIAGFSRGGGQSLFSGLSNPDKFAYVGSYSAYLTQEVLEKFIPDFLARPDAANSQLKLLWMGVGRDDFLYTQASTFDKLLTDKKITHKSLTTDGGHTWMNARHYLTETLQLYFK
jgi:enterochelin esterase family protein